MPRTVIALTLTTFLSLAMPTQAQMQSGGETAQSVRPVRILVEANTVTPSFYAGRNEPTRGSQVYVVGLISPEAQQAPSPYTFRWRIDDRAVANTTNVPHNRHRFTAPERSTVQVQLEVVDASGRVVGNASRLVPIQQPAVVFYAESLLYGLSQTAVADSVNLVGDEVVVRAMPYFAIPPLDSTAYELRWVQGNESVRVSDNPLALTLRRDTVAKNSRVSFSLRNRGVLSQTAAGNFFVTYE